MSKIERSMELLQKKYGTPEPKNLRRPIDSLIRVILSQNTNDRNSRKAYRRLMDKFGSAEGIAEAEIEGIADSISVGGLQNLKAERIKRSLEVIEEEREDLSLGFLDDMELEDAREWLMKLPGIGPKSAAVVLNFDFGKAAFPVDTHIFRVSKRLGLIPEDSTRRKAHEILEGKVTGERMFEFHVNLIRHGREVCIAGVPRCSECPLTEICDYHEMGEGLKR